MATRLERHVQSGAAIRNASRTQGVDLGVGLAMALVAAIAYQPAAAYELLFSLALFALLAGVAVALIGVLILIGLWLSDSDVPADLLYAACAGFALILVLYFGSGVAGVRLLSRGLFDVVVPLLGAVLPFVVFAWIQILSGRLHRALGPDGG